MHNISIKYAYVFIVLFMFMIENPFVSNVIYFLFDWLILGEFPAQRASNEEIYPIDDVIVA